MLVTEETAGKVGGGLKVEAWLQELEEKWRLVQPQCKEPMRKLNRGEN